MASARASLAKATSSAPSSGCAAASRRPASLRVFASLPAAGVAVASRQPSIEHRTDIGLKTFDTKGRWLEADFAVPSADGGDDRVLTVVSAYVHSGEAGTPKQADKMRFLGSMLKRLPQLRAHTDLAVVMGDLNDVAWSRTSDLFRRAGGMLDPRVGRGFYPTFNANYPLLRWPLDHLFVSPHFKVMQLDLLPDIGSDHLPIFFRLCLTEDGAERKVAPSAAPPTEAEASSEIQSGLEETREEQRGQ